MDLKELAAATGLHPNTVRFHLAVLVQAGFVSAETGDRRGRGRPGTVYRSVAPASPPSGYQFLSAVLAAEIDRRGAGDLAEAAGRSWLRQPSVGPPSDGADPLHQATRRVLAVFTELGFEPAVTDEPGASRIDLRTCPFITVAEQHPDVVCGLHRGLLRAAAQAFEPDAITTDLVPFARPGVCVARVIASEGAATS